MSSLYTREKKEGCWRYRRIKTGRGMQTGHIKGPFYARPFFQGKQIWKTLLATTFETAQEEAEHLTTALEAQAKGLTTAELENSRNTNRMPLRTAVEKFLQNAQGSKRKLTVVSYRINLQQFLAFAPIKFLDEITRSVLCDFRNFLQQKGYTVRTQHQRLMAVLILLKSNRIKTEFSLKKDLPKIEKEIATPYTPDQLKKLFAATTPEETLRYRFFLGTGCRDQEVRYASWDDIDFDRRTFHIRSKSDVGFQPKSSQDRVVLMPTSLVEALKVRKQNPPHNRWIFVNENGEPERHFLDKLKRIALKAGLNCGRCRTTLTKGRYKKHQVKVSCETEPVCQNFYLHRFRKTCATRWHENKIPLLKIQYWLGHESLETTQIYLGVPDSPEDQSNVDRSFGD